MNILIGGAWPYANGPLHVGHISSLLPGDILARYYRQKGENVCYVSGSDCNGTPIVVRAREEGVTPEEIADRYHASFVDCFQQLGFSYDNYTRTDSEHHHEVVQGIFKQLLDNGFLYTVTTDQTYCEVCVQFLPDRYVEGRCPKCGQQARGDQCDACSAILEPVDLLDRRCKLCGTEPVTRPTEHFYFRLSAFQTETEQWLETVKVSGGWRANAIALTERYLNEGLHDRAATRDLPVGVTVPVEGFQEKKIYVWIEAVSGYLSATLETNPHFWETIDRAYYVHGKDNIPFHTIIWPSILRGIRRGGLPTHIISNEYMTLEKRKLSTSQNWAVWVPDLLARYHPDSIRYFLTINAPEQRDADFSWSQFVHSHNGELLGAYGNFVHRTLKFVERAWGGTVPDGRLDEVFVEAIGELYQTTGQRIESGYFKSALEEVFASIRSANKYFDAQEPWKTVQTDMVKCKDTIATCVFLIANYARLLAPFLPNTSAQILE
ncbi:MAG: methionine--tRNA ligase, partial [Bacilli bacterium]